MLVDLFCMSYHRSSDISVGSLLEFPLPQAKQGPNDVDFPNFWPWFREEGCFIGEGMLDLADIQVTSQSPILLSTSLRAQEPDLWPEAGSQGQLNGTVDGEVDVSWLWWNLFSPWARLFILDVYLPLFISPCCSHPRLLVVCACLFLAFLLHPDIPICREIQTQLPTARG